MKIDAKKLDALIDKFVAPSGKKISLKKDFATIVKLPDVSKEELKSALEDGKALLTKEQDKLYAARSHGLLIVFQAMDAAGKDSTIKHVMSGVNPQGCQVNSFKAPSSEELNHDYLWRCSKVAPERGYIGIFNRSYYEEVLITKVHPEYLAKQNLPPELRDKDIYKRRYEEISAYEKYLVNNGISVLKFFLHVSKEEQRKRFLERIDLNQKNWKFSAQDAFERERWDDYQDAYQQCIAGTSTSFAPWYIVPADYKPLTRLFVAHVIYKTLKDLKLKYPAVTPEQKKQLIEAKQMLEK
ncbi:MAG: polyphosphate kinase 2 family protein [Candidatus Melainabacteria bacterium]|nr:polyphosphate kinase 2 family protein [Candidatus Melainabacteria bacterium]